MFTKYELTEQGKAQAQKDAAYLREELKATIDKMNPEQLLALFMQLNSENAEVVYRDSAEQHSA